ncbi:hypothetical protein [Costertonia aggregata]|uniref:Glycosyl hydrolase family 16 n=1 Tax=Costertonia aggregata TaxID=343403 RepID=A0A7H9AS83_9FLAO|nr:hypothetical protein [Costertonia aggregata]QLG46212.1 hypothetical protein HYG79_12935 [Costertonia aggregata]
MKNIKHTNIQFILFLSLCIVIFSGCEREFSDEVKFAKFPSNGDVFIDAFAGLDYFPFVDGGADPEAFSVVTDEVFSGTSAIRFDVPAFGNGFVGASFSATGARDLSGFDALTFYAKASQAADINEIGFGIEGSTANKFQVTLQNLAISTKWEKYVIPIPDPSKLINQTGLFWLAEGAENENDENGFVIWFDEIKFEKLGTVAQPRPAIFLGEELEVQTFTGSVINLNGLTQTFNLGSGVNKTVIVAPSYFEFTSSDPDIARVDERGMISILGSGFAEVTAILGGVKAQGSLSLESLGTFATAPIPTRNPSNVISIFSDAYTNVPVDFFNGFFGGQTTTGGTLDISGDNVILYENLNFVSTEFTNPTINASQMTHFHVDIQVNEALEPGDTIRVELLDFGGDNAFGGGNDSGGSVTFTNTELESRAWVSLDIPLTNFTGPAAGGAFNGLNSTTNIAQVTFASGNVSTIFVDNMYFYSE